MTVRRCSALASRAQYCEPPAATQDIAYVNSIEVTSIFGVQTPLLTLDPDWHTSRAKVTLYSTPVAHESSWSLFDQQGTQVLGPVEVPGERSQVEEFQFNPAAALEQQDRQLADGLYTVRFTVTVTKGDLTRTGTADRSVQLINDPPADEPDILTARRLWRQGTAVTPYFEVASYPGSWASGTLRLRNSHGKAVSSATITNPCWTGDCAQPWKVHVAHQLGMPRPGRYDVELTIPDSWGRLSVMPLGKIKVERLIKVQRTVIAVASKALTSRRGDTRIYQVRTPSLSALVMVDRVVAEVDTTGQHPAGLTAVRIPSLSRYWMSGERLEDARGPWREVRGMGVWTVLRAKPVQIRVEGGAAASHLDRVRIRITAHVFR